MAGMKEQSGVSGWPNGVAPAPFRNAETDYHILPRPEVVLLLDTTGHIVRVSAKYPGKRLDRLTFERGRSAHDVLHPGCDGSGCRFVRHWRAAWAAHKSGLPIEWSFVSKTGKLDLTLRLQAVSYACSVLYGAAVHSYEDCSVLFVRDNQSAAIVPTVVSET